jgi:hypothetical protein
MPIKENILIYILRRDLQLDDNPVFHKIAQLYSSREAQFTHVLPLYVFNGFFASELPPYPEAKSLIGKAMRPA